MDIKLIKKADNCEFVPFADNILLQITDSQYEINQYVGKDLWVLNTESNEKFEIAPEIKKFSFLDITYACSEHEYLFFTSAVAICDDEIEISIYRYLLDNAECEKVYSFNTNLKELGSSLNIKIFVLDIDHIIIQESFYKSQEGLELPAWKGIGVNQIILYEVSTNQKINICDNIVTKSGIDRMIALEGNYCLIKLGDSLVGEKLHGGIENKSAPREVIGFINVKQFISELILNTENVFIEELDYGENEVTFPYVRKSEDWIIYSKLDAVNKVETIVLYDYINKVKKVRINNNIVSASDLSYTYVINEVPYQLKKENKVTHFVNMNTQKVDVQLPSSMEVLFVENNLIVVSKSVRKLFFSKKTIYTEVYDFEDMKHPVFRTKEKYSDCIRNGKDFIILTL